MISTSSAQKYEWGEKCLGWHLVNTPSLSVIQEKMPPATSEKKHKHSKSQQFFFILNGEATFDLEGIKEIVQKGEGIHIMAGQGHRVSNEGKTDLEFLVISQPHSHGDRIDL